MGLYSQTDTHKKSLRQKATQIEERERDTVKINIYEVNSAFVTRTHHIVMTVGIHAIRIPNRIYVDIVCQTCPLIYLSIVIWAIHSHHPAYMYVQYILYTHIYIYIDCALSYSHKNVCVCVRSSALTRSHTHNHARTHSAASIPFSPNWQLKTIKT